MYSFKYSQQDASYTMFFIAVNALRVSGGFSAHHLELKTVHTQHLVYVRLACCYC
jgi:hypothetical protein